MNSLELDVDMSCECRRLRLYVLFGAVLTRDVQRSSVSTDYTVIGAYILYHIPGGARRPINLRDRDRAGWRSRVAVLASSAITHGHAHHPAQRTLRARSLRSPDTASIVHTACVPAFIGRAASARDCGHKTSHRSLRRLGWRTARELLCPQMQVVYQTMLRV